VNDASNIDIIVSGHLCLDLIPDMAHVPPGDLATPGRLHEVGPLTISTGGVVSNTGLALHRLGADVRLMATVGSDLLGRVIIASLKDRDPHLGEFITVQPGLDSSYTIVLAPSRADRTFLHCAGANSAFSAANVDFALLRRAKLFHLGYPPILPRLIADDGASLSRLYQQARDAGAVTSLDMTLPDPKGPSGQADWKTILQRTLPYVDIFLPSIEEIVFMLRRSDYEAWNGVVRDRVNRAYVTDLADELLALGVAVAGFKLGELGMFLKTARTSRIAQMSRLPIDPYAWSEQTVYTPAFAVDVVNTLGAGDSAYAGFLAALVRGLSPQACLTWACAVGACNCEAADATSGVRSWDETQQRIDQGWPLHHARLTGI